MKTQPDLSEKSYLCILLILLYPYQQLRGVKLQCYLPHSQQTKCSQDSEKCIKQHFGLESDTPTHTKFCGFQEWLLPLALQAQILSCLMRLLLSQLLGHSKPLLLTFSSFSSHLTATIGLSLFLNLRGIIIQFRLYFRQGWDCVEAATFWIVWERKL